METGLLIKGTERRTKGTEREEKEFPQVKAR